MAIKRLSEFARVQSGLVLSRKEAKNKESSEHYYQKLSLKALEKSGIEMELLEPFHSSEKLSGQFLTQKNDIIMRTFTPFNPVLVADNQSNLLVTSQLVSIRIIEPELVLPYYIYLYLSQEEVAAKLSATETWVAQRVVKVSTIAEISIPIPTIAKQKQVIEISRLSKKRKTLYRELIAQEDLLIKGVTNLIIGGK